MNVFIEPLDVYKTVNRLLSKNSLFLLYWFSQKKLTYALHTIITTMTNNKFSREGKIRWNKKSETKLD